MAKSLPTPFNPPPPTTLLRWRHSFARAKRRKFKFDIFKMRVSVDKICKFDFKFESKKLRRSIFSLDEADLNFAMGATLSVVTE